MKKKPMYEHGELMRLTWDTDSPDFEYVRGHVTAQEFAHAAHVAHWGPDDPYKVPVPAVVEHLYGCWVPDTSGEHGMLFREAHGPGPGKFPITRAPYEVINPPHHTVRQETMAERWRREREDLAVSLVGWARDPREGNQLPRPQEDA